MDVHGQFMNGFAIPAERPWLQWYDPGVPSAIEVPDEPLPTFLARSAARFPDRPAIRFFGRSMTYRELDDAVNRCANALFGLGIGRGDRVALLMPNCPQMVIAYYGGLRAGAVLVPTSPLCAEAELTQIWTDAGVRVVVCLSAMYPHVAAVRQHIPSLEHIVVTNIKAHFPPHTKLLFTLLKERSGGHRQHLVQDGHTHRFQALLAGASSADPAVPIGVDDLALLQPTGGTTGTPKLAMLTHRNVLANALQVRAWQRDVAASSGPTAVLGVLPLFHIYGMSTVLNLSIVGGDTMILQPRFVLKDVLRALDRERPDLFPGVPTMYMAINHTPGLQRYNLRSLKVAISGAAPLPQEVQTQFEQLTGAMLVEGYGLTEASPVTHCNPLQGRRRVGSIGIPLPSTDAAIVDSESGARTLTPGMVGELAVRGPQVMQGYWNRADETAQVLQDGWLLTGDLATMDADGFFAIVDRKKDMILSSGMNVYPREVEEPLYRHPKVKQAVAVGIPDERWGEAIKAYIVLKDGQSATAEEIIDYCHEHMARYKVPKFVEFRRELPQTMVGKVLRRQLQEEERAARAGAPTP